MYQILLDNSLPLYDPRDPDLIVRDPDCHLAVGEPGQLSFTVDPDHPYIDRIALMKRVTLNADGRAIYRGRIRRAVKEFDLPLTVETEGLLACLNDSIIPPYNFPADWEEREDAAYLAELESENGNVVRFFLGWLIDQHNSQVGPDQQIQLGDVSVADPNNYLYRASESRMTTMEAVKKKLFEGLGGYPVVDYSQPVPVLHYYADLPLTNVQAVEFGGNLLDLTTETDATDTYTAILPVGSEGLTLSALPDGELTPGYIKAGEIIYSQIAEEAQNGQRIIRLEEWQDVTVADHLQTKALTKLSTEGVKAARTITVKAVDLGGVGEISRFVVGRYVQLTSRPHGYNVAYPLTELNPDILDPGNTEITLGATVKTAADLALGGRHQLEETLNHQQIAMNQQKENATQTQQALQSQITSAIQTSQTIIFEAMEQYVQTGNFTEYQQTVTAQMEILAGQISLRFDEATKQTENVNGDLQTVKTDLEKHFDFTIDGLVIKAGENAMQLVIDNDLIQFKKNGEPFGWWDGVDFHTGNIIIDVNERAQFGNYAMIPRNNGSTSFLKVR